VLEAGHEAFGVFDFGVFVNLLVGGEGRVRAELVRTAEFAADFGHVAVAPDWGDFEGVGQGELEFAVGGVFFEEAVEDFAGFGGVICAKGSLLVYNVHNLLGALPMGRHLSRRLWAMRLRAVGDRGLAKGASLFRGDRDGPPIAPDRDRYATPTVLFNCLSNGFPERLERPLCHRGLFARFHDPKWPRRLS
jgi:hypothetical protein